MNDQGKLAEDVAAQMRDCGADDATGPMVLDALGALGLKLVADETDLALKAFVGDPEAEAVHPAVKAAMYGEKS